MRLLLRFGGLTGSNPLRLSAKSETASLAIPPLAQKINQISNIKYQKSKLFKYYTKNFSLLTAIKDTNDANM